MYPYSLETSYKNFLHTNTSLTIFSLRFDFFFGLRSNKIYLQFPSFLNHFTFYFFTVYLVFIFFGIFLQDTKGAYNQKP